MWPIQTSFAVRVCAVGMTLNMVPFFIFEVLITVTQTANKYSVWCTYWTVQKLSSHGNGSFSITYDLVMTMD
jgi:hypothetical protein